MRLVPFLTAIFISSTLALAQPAQPAPAARPLGHGMAGQVGGGQNTGRIDPSQFSAQILEAIQDQMGASEDDWKTLKPKIEKVRTAQQNARTGAGLSIRGSNGAATVVQPMPQSESKNAPAPTQAMKEIRDAIADQNVSADEITKRIAAFREARDKAKAELQQAQKELKDAVTPRQEAVLLSFGILD